MHKRAFFIISCVLALALTVPALAFAGNGQATEQDSAPGEYAKGTEGSKQECEPLQQQTRVQAQTQDQGEGADQPKVRVRSERRVGEYPEESPGTGDRDRVRDRSSEVTETPDSTETVDPPGDPDEGSGESTDTVETPDTNESAGLLDQIAQFVEGIMRSLGF